MKQPCLLRFLAAAAVISSPLQAQSGLTRLGEFKVNTFTTNAQSSPTIASDAVGNFVVVWHSVDQDGSNLGIYAQRYNTAGSPLGQETRVNVTTIYGEQNPGVAMDAAGNFLVVWKDSGQDSTKGAIYGRRFSAVANDFSAPFLVSDVAGVDEFYPVVAMAPDGRAVVGWIQTVNASQDRLRAQRYSGPAGGNLATGSIIEVSGPQAFDLDAAVGMADNGDFVFTWAHDVFGTDAVEVFSRAYSADGNPKTEAFIVNQTHGNAETAANVAVRSDGKFTVVWQAENRDGSGKGIFFRQFEASGAPDVNGANAGNESPPVNTFTTGDQVGPSCTYDANGNLIILWTSANQDGSGRAVAAQRFDASGAALGSELTVNTTFSGDQTTAGQRPTAVFDPEGNFVAVWQSQGQDGSDFGIYAEKFYLPNQGPPLSEFRVNTTTKGDQTYPAVAVMSDGRFVIVWRGIDATGNDAIFGQRYGADGRRFGAEFAVNTSLPANNFLGVTRTDSLAPGVAFDSAGAFTVVWVVASDGDGPGIAGRRFPWDPQMAPGSEFPANPQSAGNQVSPSIGVAGDGRFVVAWNRYDTTGATIQRNYAQFFTANGTPTVGVELGNFSYEPAVAVSPLGRFVITRRDNGRTNDLWLQQFDLDGAGVGSEKSLDGSSDGEQHASGIAVRADGSMIATWDSIGGGDGNGSTAVYGLKLDATGAGIGNAFQINTFAPGDQTSSSVAIGPGSDFIVCYRSAGIDGSGLTVAAQRFKSGTTTPAKDGSELVINQFRSGDQSPSGRQRSIGTDGLGNYVVVWESQNQDGSGYGIYATKVTVSESPNVVTLSAADVGATTATLHATIDPNGQTATLAFEYDDDPGFGSAAVVQVPGSFSGINPLDAEVQVVQGLVKGVTYSFRAKATVGTQVIVGNTLTFTTANAAPVAKADTFYVTGQDQTLDVLANDTDPDLPGDVLALSGALPQPSFMAEDGSMVVAGTLQKITLGSREAFSFTAKNTFTDRAGFDYAVADADGLTSTAAVQLFRFTALRGIYSGLVTDTSGVEPDGVLKLTVNAVAGRFTGVLFWGGGSYPVDSFFAADGSVTLGVAGTALQFTLRVTDPLEGTIAGTLTDNTVPSQPVTATISLMREDDGGGDDNTSPSPGNYTTFIDEPQIIDPGAGAAAAAEPRGGVSTSPTGTGFSFAKIGTKKQKRRGRFATSLADGSKFTAGSGLAGRSYTLAQALYKIRNGQFGGSFNSQPTFPSGNNSRFESSASWTRSAIPGIPGSEFFPGGFRLKLTLAGVPYDGRRANPINFPENGGNNAKVTFKGGGLDADLPFFVKVDRRNRVMSGSADLVVRMNKVAGTFSGSFVHPGETTRVKFIGLFQQNSAVAPALEQGLGYFRALGLRRTGRVVMKAN